jgi:hypothetical protein
MTGVTHARTRIRPALPQSVRPTQGSHRRGPSYAGHCFRRQRLVAVAVVMVHVVVVAMALRLF